jgi:hydrogenase maturation protease
VTRRILVAGLGNVLMSDDAAGPYCVEQLIANYEFPGEVTVADLGTPGLDLALHMASADVVVAVDALRGVEPGSVHVFDEDAVLSGQFAARLDTHAPALGESILRARMSVGRPSHVRLVGVGGAAFDHGTGLSPIVSGQIGQLCDRVLAELTTLGVAWQPRAEPVRAAVWWEQEAKGDLCVG